MCTVSEYRTNQWTITDSAKWGVNKVHIRLYPNGHIGFQGIEYVTISSEQMNFVITTLLLVQSRAKELPPRIEEN
jgi:hypothetical protein